MHSGARFHQPEQFYIHIQASKVKRSCQARTRKSGDTFQENIRGGKDGLHMEKWLLSEVGGNRGAKNSSEDVGSEHEDCSWILLLIYSSLLCILFILCLSTKNVLM